MLFLSPTGGWGGQKKSHNDPGFSDKVCFLLQLGCYCLISTNTPGKAGCGTAKGLLPLVKGLFFFFLSKAQTAVLEGRDHGKPREVELQPYSPATSRTQSEAPQLVTAQASALLGPPGLGPPNPPAVSKSAHLLRNHCAWNGSDISRGPPQKQVHRIKPGSGLTWS